MPVPNTVTVPSASLKEILSTPTSAVTTVPYALVRVCRKLGWKARRTPPSRRRTAVRSCDPWPSRRHPSSHSTVRNSSICTSRRVVRPRRRCAPAWRPRQVPRPRWRRPSDDEREQLPVAHDASPLCRNVLRLVVRRGSGNGDERATFSRRDTPRRRCGHLVQCAPDLRRQGQPSRRSSEPRSWAAVRAPTTGAVTPGASRTQASATSSGRQSRPSPPCRPRRRCRGCARRGTAR